MVDYQVLLTGGQDFTGAQPPPQLGYGYYRFHLHFILGWQILYEQRSLSKTESDVEIVAFLDEDLTAERISWKRAGAHPEVLSVSLSPDEAWPHWRRSWDRVSMICWRPWKATTPCRTVSDKGREPRQVERWPKNWPGCGDIETRCGREVVRRPCTTRWADHKRVHRCSWG